MSSMLPMTFIDSLYTMCFTDVRRGPNINDNNAPDLGGAPAARGHVADQVHPGRSDANLGWQPRDVRGGRCPGRECRGASQLPLPRGPGALNIVQALFRSAAMRTGRPQIECGRRHREAGADQGKCLLRAVPPRAM